MKKTITSVLIFILFCVLTAYVLDNNKLKNQINDKNIEIKNTNKLLIIEKNINSESKKTIKEALMKSCITDNKPYEICDCMSSYFTEKYTLREFFNISNDENWEASKRLFDEVELSCMLKK